MPPQSAIQRLLSVLQGGPLDGKVVAATRAVVYEVQHPTRRSWYWRNPTTTQPEFGKLLGVSKRTVIRLEGATALRRREALQLAGLLLSVASTADAEQAKDIELAALSVAGRAIPAAEIAGRGK